MRVQIISSRVGGGHQSVAQALRHALERAAGPRIQVWVDDLYVELGRPPLSGFPSMYALLTRRFPRVWRFIYDATNRPPSGPRYNWIGDVVGGPSLKSLIAARKPHTVVTVLPGTTGFTARSVLRSGVHANVEVVITDWADVHLGWASTFPAHYTVPTENALHTLLSVGIPRTDVDVHGLLVREQFMQVDRSPEGRRGARERLGLPLDRFVVLAMVGTEGSPEALAHLQAVASTPLDADILVVCGRNQRLYRLVQQMRGVNPIVPLGYVEQVADLMLASDVLLTKTGGVTLAEAFCCDLPVLAFDPLPGQEEGNARYMVASGAAELATRPSHLAALTAELRWSPARRAVLMENGRKLAAPGAATATARSILARIQRAGEWPSR